MFGSLSDLVSRDPDAGELVARVAIFIKGRTFNRGASVPPELLFGDGSQPDLWDRLYEWTVEADVTDTLIKIKEVYRD